LGLAVGDVAGKGVPAALYAAFVSGMVRARAFERRAPSELMARANRTLNRRGVEGLFCTLAYARFDFARGELCLSSSGLPYPLHYLARDGSCAPVEVAGLPLGAFPEASYDELALPIAGGDVLLFHSDGLSEAYNGREGFGLGRMLESLQASAGEPAEEIAARMLSALDAFLGGADPGDDVTLVVVKVR
jgi:sigma-B regulation protein RsbU (phosphoserine phosphatase)